MAPCPRPAPVVRSRLACRRGAECTRSSPIDSRLRTIMRAIVGRVVGVGLAFVITLSPGTASSGEEPWIDLIGDHGLVAWRPPTGNWLVAGDARPDSKNPKRLLAEPGKGVLVNGPVGRTTNLVTNEKFGDIEAHFEFMIPKGSNSGVKFEGLYEIQIFDSFGVVKPNGSQHGGIYPRAELLPRYHYLDEGVSPRVNASRPAGEWQTLDVIFLAPQFDASGKQDPERPIRKGRPQRTVDPRARRGQVSHGPCLADQGNPERADPAPGRSWTGGLPQYPGPTSCLGRWLVGRRPLGDQDSAVASPQVGSIICCCWPCC